MVVENYTQDLKESVYHSTVISALGYSLYNDWKITNKDEPLHLSECLMLRMVLSRWQS